MSKLRKILIGQAAVLASALAFGATSDASAYSYGSWGSAGGFGSHGSFASHGGSFASHGSHAQVGHVGPLRRIAARRHARRAARASWGSHGSHGVAFGSAGSFGSVGGFGSAGSYGSVGGHGFHGGVIYGAQAPRTGGAMLASSGSASIQVTLPEDAKVYVNDQLTTSTGSSRNYVSNALESGRSYVYNIRVEFELDGKQVEKSEVVRLTAGEQVALSFSADDEPRLASAAGDIKTELKLHVPEAAKVYLAGTPTQQDGSDRVYATHRLTPGQAWDGYTVRVELEKNGETVVEERVLTIHGGESYELAFSFDQDADQLADTELADTVASLQ